MKIALVHDWLFHMRGGEKVLEAFSELYPDAVIHTLFYDRDKLSPPLQRMKIKASPLQCVPGIKRFYRWLLPILPAMIQKIEIDPDTDLVLSSSHCVAKGIRIPPKAFHVSYIHTPMRYLWGFEKDYFGNFPFWIKPFIKLLLRPLRIWDLESNKKVSLFIANSENVRSRIKNFYGREAKVIHPPLDTNAYQAGPHDGDFYLVVSAFVPYKKVDLVIETFNALDRKLLIVGSGPMEKRYKQLRKTDRISFLGSVSNQELSKIYSQAKALIFPTNEDFGIVPLEAQACGTPVIALKEGGALESVKTGLFFSGQTKEALRKAILEFEGENFDRTQIPSQVESFSKEFFKQRIKECVTNEMASRSLS
ncbi:MAG: glycosyltransferase family 4 protein [Candidatus Omnitrophica bacterium]|nr:glycosyltransferase family 4 protein [Candidatus Omnitrophota bacterium]